MRLLRWSDARGSLLLRMKVVNGWESIASLFSVMGIDLGHSLESKDYGIAALALFCKCFG